MPYVLVPVVLQSDVIDLDDCVPVSLLWVHFGGASSV